MRLAFGLLCCVWPLAACDGDDDGGVADDGPPPTDAADPDASGPDAAVDCPDFFDCESSSNPGVIYVDGCAPVACGLFRYGNHEVDAHAESVAVSGPGPLRFSYVRTQPARQVRMVTFSGFSDELVAPITAAGATQGTSITRIGSASGDVIWVVWSEADGHIHAAHRSTNTLVWTLTLDIATGTRPVLDGFGSQPALAYVGAGGIHVRTYDGNSWSPPTVIAADVAALDLARFSDGFDNVLVAWRTPSQEVRVARSRAGMPFVTTVLESGLPPNPNGATVDLFETRLVYGLDADTSVSAELISDGTWRKRTFGHFRGQGSGAGWSQSIGAAFAYTSDVGVHVGSFLNNGLTHEQVVSRRCGHGAVLIGSNVTSPVIAHLCADGTLYVLDGGLDFPDGWNARCLAASGELADAANTCAIAQACIIEGGRSLCGTGAYVDDVAYAQTCGDPTVDPAIIDACEAATPGVACMPQGNDGTATVPAACAP
jgi:hypothetical protein